MSGDSASLTISNEKLSVFTRIAKQLLFKQLAKIHTGHLVIEDCQGEYQFGQPAELTSLRVIMHVNDTACYQDLVLGGSIGAGESYMSGDWQVNDLLAFIQLFVRNMDVLDQVDNGWLRVISRPIAKWHHRRLSNTEKGAKRNIAAHYDLGNSMFATFLDPTMMYSSGIFPSPQASMQQASEYKLDVICQKLNLQPADRVVEIGTGWGGFAMHAARHYGCHVTTTTISDQQFDYAQQRIAKAGLSKQITLLKRDYRQLEGEYDKLVSIEMIEAVGLEYYDTYFAKCASLLKPDGQMLIQAITISDQRFDSYRKNVDFIQKYIFPGAGLPSVSVMLESVSQHTDMRLVQLQDFAEHYAKTLSAWCERFMQHSEQVRQLGYSDEFIRMWEFYLRYCEGGFAERWIGVSHLHFAKPACRSEQSAHQI